MLKVFIDTNIYLSFLGGASGKLGSLKKLLTLIKKGKIKVILTKQAEREFYKNRTTKFSGWAEAVRKESISLVFPSIAKDAESRELSDNLEQAKEEIEKAYLKALAILKKQWEKIKQEATEADLIVKEIFEKAEKIEDDNTVILKAHNRFLKGAPPGKRQDGIGDSVNWESILKKCGQSDLALVTSDRDYQEPLREGELNRFLLEDWKRVSRKKLRLFVDLGEFINFVEGKAVIANEEVVREKKEAERAAAQAEAPTITRVTPYYGETLLTSTPPLFTVGSSLTSTSVTSGGTMDLFSTPYTNLYTTSSPVLFNSDIVIPGSGQADELGSLRNKFSQQEKILDEIEKKIDKLIAEKKI